MIPLILITLIITIINIRRDRTYVQDQLESQIRQFSTYLDINLEKYRDYAFFIANQKIEIVKQGGLSHYRLPGGDIFINRYNLRLYEMFLKDSLAYKNLYYWKDKIFAMPDTISYYIWNELDQPVHDLLYSASYPFIVSNTLVIYNCAIIPHPVIKGSKLGFCSIATPLDKEFFEYYYNQDDTSLYFIQSDESIRFSDDRLETMGLAGQINRLYQTDRKKYLPLRYNREDYYILRKPLMRIPSVQDGKISSFRQGYVGVLIKQSLLNQELRLFRIVSVISLGISFILLLFISLWYANRLTTPIQELQKQIDLFDKFREPMSPSSPSKDEIGDLHTAFSKLSSHILIKNAEIEDERNKLHSQNQTMLADLEIARRIQTSLMPQDSPSRQIYYYYKPMQQVGGDFFDFIDLPSGKTGFFISDVSGHGVPAALITAMLKSFLLQNKKIAELPAIFMTELNRFLWDQTGGNFVTAMYGVFDPYLKDFSYANAGHAHPLVVRDHAVFSPMSSNRQPPLGVMSINELNFLGKSFFEYKLQLESNDFLLLYTDGIMEAVNYEKSRIYPNSPIDEFGDIMLCNSLIRHSYKTNIELVNGIINDLVVFRGNDQFDDDVCVICLKIAEQQTPLSAGPGTT